MASYKPPREQRGPAFFSLLSRTTDRRPLPGSGPGGVGEPRGRSSGGHGRGHGQSRPLGHPKGAPQGKARGPLTHASKDREPHTLPLARLRAGGRHTRTLVHTQQ